MNENIVIIHNTAGMPRGWYHAYQLDDKKNIAQQANEIAGKGIAYLHRSKILPAYYLYVFLGSD